LNCHIAILTIDMTVHRGLALFVTLLNSILFESLISAEIIFNYETQDRSLGIGVKHRQSILLCRMSSKSDQS